MTDITEGAVLSVDNSRVWLLAASPLLLLAVSAAFLFAGVTEADSAAWVIALATTVGLSVWDARYLRSRGVASAPAGLSWLVPGYLWRRSNLLGQSQGPLVVWIAAAVVSVAGFFVVSAHFVTLNMSAVQDEIAQWATKNGVTDPSVHCPSSSVYAVHDDFTCTLGASGSVTVQVLVTVRDSRGYLTWEIVG